MKTDKAKADVVKIPGVRKEEHEAECTMFYTTIKKRCDYISDILNAFAVKGIEYDLRKYGYIFT